MAQPQTERAGAVAAAPSSRFVPCRKRTSPNNPAAPKKAIAARRAALRAIGPNGDFTVIGQTAKALAALVAAGARGITALEVSSWAYRLGAYVHVLRHRHGLAIELRKEPHEGGWHGRYVLRSIVTLEAVP